MSATWEEEIEKVAGVWHSWLPINGRWPWSLVLGFQSTMVSERCRAWLLRGTLQLHLALLLYWGTLHRVSTTSPFQQHQGSKPSLRGGSFHLTHCRQKTPYLLPPSQLYAPSYRATGTPEVLVWDFWWISILSPVFSTHPKQGLPHTSWFICSPRSLPDEITTWDWALVFLLTFDPYTVKNTHRALLTPPAASLSGALPGGLCQLAAQ